MQQHGKHAPKSIDEAVERVLQFDRNWAGFDFPRYLMAVSRIQAEVLGQSDHEVGDYSFFASQVENHFEPAELTAMDEFGIPVQVGRKIVELVASDGELDRGGAAPGGGGGNFGGRQQEITQETLEAKWEIDVIESQKDYPHMIWASKSVRTIYE